MNQSNRPPPSVLLIHDGVEVGPLIRYLQEAGLRATESHADRAIPQAITLLPDIIVLDYDCHGDIMAVLQEDPRTRGIPVIALADLPPRRDDGKRRN